MQTNSISKYEGLANPFYGKNVDESNLTKPSDDKKMEIAKETAKALGIKVTAKTDSSYVFYLIL